MAAGDIVLAAITIIVFISFKKRYVFSIILKSFRDKAEICSNFMREERYTKFVSDSVDFATFMYYDIKLYF